MSEQPLSAKSSYAIWHGPWTVHICEDHGRLDCAICGVHDVVRVVAQEKALELAKWTQHLRTCARASTTAERCTCGLDEAWEALGD